MGGARPVLVAKVENRGMLARFVRAALLHEIAHVPLAEAPRGSGAHTLQLRFGAAPGISVAAEPVGTGAKNAFPLRLRPLDPSHIAELEALLGEDGPSSGGSAPPPMSASGSAIFADNPPLPEGGSARPPPPRARLESITEPSAGAPPPPSSTDSHDPSVLFDPEQALIGRAPARPRGTNAEDTLTVPIQNTPPVRPSAAPPARPSAGPASVHTAPMPGAQNARGSGRPTAASEISISVELESLGTKSSAKTHRDARTEADESDPSISESVVIDPDVLARERRASAAPPPPRPEGADGEAISVVFGDEKTSPNVDVPKPAVGVVVKGAIEEVAVATGRRPSVRRDPRVEDDDEVDDEAETLMRESVRAKAQQLPDAVVESRAMTSSRRQRTPKRTQVDVVAGRTIANKYRIQSLVGSGAVGAVYKGTHEELERIVAIKVLHEHYREDVHLMQQFRSEARAASLLHHPNVTIVHDFGEEPDGLVYIVMEYLQGWTLQTVLDEERRLPVRRVIPIMLQVCGALAAAHERGIVHRDVKPDNIILVPSRDDDGRPVEVVKVCDFGIAALESMTPPSEEYTAGTPEYMAPEQAAGRADARTDVYACGVLLYEMVTGAAPFVADTAVGVLKKHATEAPVPPTQLAPDVPPALEAVILRALEKAPERRWQGARELRAELKRIMG